MISIAQFKRELQDARLIRLRAHGAERRRSKTGVWRTEDRRVRQIERLRAELQREPLLQLRVLVQRDVRAPRVVPKWYAGGVLNTCVLNHAYGSGRPTPDSRCSSTRSDFRGRR